MPRETKSRSQHRRSRSATRHGSHTRDRRSRSHSRRPRLTRDRCSRSCSRRPHLTQDRRFRSRSRRPRLTVTPRRSRERRSRSTLRSDSLFRDRRRRRHNESRLHSAKRSRADVYSRGRSRSRSGHQSIRSRHSKRLGDTTSSPRNNSHNVVNSDRIVSTENTLQQENFSSLEQSNAGNREVNIDNSTNGFEVLQPEPTVSETGSIKHIDTSQSLVNIDIIDTLNKALQAITTANPQNTNKFSANNAVPEFDPKVKNQTIITWLNKVNECAEIYGWDSKQTAHYALPKLTGTAKRWYEGQPSVMHTWDIWQEKLKSAFPVYENYGRLLSEMLEKKAKFGDDLEEYYYEKLIALNRCGITGRNAIDCIVYGVEDRSVRYGAEAVGFEDADKLLGYLKNVKNERFDKNNKKIVRPNLDLFRKPQKNDSNRQIRCFNCHELGHVVTNCKKPLLKCQKCKRVGHDDPNCSREVWKDKIEVKSL